MLLWIFQSSTITDGLPYFVTDRFQIRLFIKLNHILHDIHTDQLTVHRAVTLAFCMTSLIEGGMIEGGQTWKIAR